MKSDNLQYDRLVRLSAGQILSAMLMGSDNTYYYGKLSNYIQRPKHIASQKSFYFRVKGIVRTLKFSLKVKVMGSNPGYLLEYFLLYQKQQDRVVADL